MFSNFRDCFKAEVFALRAHERLAEDPEPKTGPKPYTDRGLLADAVTFSTLLLGFGMPCVLLMGRFKQHLNPKP